MFIFLVLQAYFLVADPDPQSMRERSALCWHLLHPRSEEIVFEEIVQDLWFVSRFLSLLFTMENLTRKMEGERILAQLYVETKRNSSQIERGCWYCTWRWLLGLHK